MNALKLLTLCMGILLAAQGSAAGYKIKTQIVGLKDTTLLLGHHFGKKKYVVDTIKVDNKGCGTFTGDSLLNGGIYLVILPSMNYFEVMIDKDQEFEIKTDTADLVKNLVFKGSDDNVQFLEYQNFMVTKQKRSAEIREEMKKLDTQDSLAPKKKDVTDAQRATYKKELESIDKEITAYWEKIIADPRKPLLASVLKAMREIDVPDAPKDANGKITDSTFQFRYYQAHYFDNVDFSDARLLRTPILESKIDAYFKKAVVPIPDSIVPATDIVIGLSRKNSEVYKYVLQYLFNQYNDNKIMGMDRVFVSIAEKYYLSGQAPWALKDSVFMSKVNDRVFKIKPNLIGEIAPELRLYNEKNQIVSLHSIKAEYIILYFFEPGCGHCKKIIPEAYEMYQKMDKEKVKLVLVDTQVDQKDWEEFRIKHNLVDCINLYDPYQYSNFRNLYDVYSTPTPYVLDKDKKIIAKRIGPETIVEFINKMIELDKAKK